jgi:peptide/nickel transport system ATP-binding protein
MALLDVTDLTVDFPMRPGVSPGTGEGALRAVDGVSFSVERGEVMGLVGESGSGKTVSCRAMLHLLPGWQAPRTGGRALFDGQDLLRLDEPALRALHGRRIGMIFQNPASHLDPLMTIGRQVAEPLIHHQGMSRREARAAAIDLLRQVGIPDPKRAVDAYPHQFSGGMKQRAVIAGAVACSPDLLVADEPTTALDVTVQAQILRLLLDLRDRTGLAIILITHDLGVVASTCDRISVMYAGRIMEQAPKAELIRNPRHPYTMGIIRSQPSRARAGEPLQSIEGQLPPLGRSPAGCRFNPRCGYAIAPCRAGEIPLDTVAPGHAAACLRWRELAEAAA